MLALALRLAVALGPVIPPETAAVLAAVLVGEPGIADDLIAICRRESRCLALGVHEVDANLSAREYWGQVRLGHLDRGCQPYGGGGWATRGAWGLSAGAHWAYLPACYRPELLDVPLVSAVVAARRYVRRCLPVRSRGWCSVPGPVWRS